MVTWSAQTLAAASTVVMLGTAGWAAWETYDAPLLAVWDRPCADPRSRPEFVAHQAHDVVVATVSARAWYPDVQLLSLRVEETLKGALPAEARVAQGLGPPPGSESLVQILEPGRRYVVSLVPAEEYGDGLVWGAVPADAGSEATPGTEEVWREAVVHPEEPPVCDDVVVVG
ncbi:hypothetical protein J7F03_17575 [Streptomyces sp. ISL-43]|uniref:hypothetical protein n=1 Tax=Streptomyces sp. ISL-43 TaxID=2819183 RepID=UPI001BE52FD7|nr:hypothetical protein [Streptomyces sp. ISL-43]MBT2448868.1 hypothetical protein [Streptomyces sp. ISL-43]